MTAPLILITVFGLSLLVIVHEAGHYLAARAFGMRVTRFSIGFGPVIVSYRPKGSPTTFQICALPILAYVMIAGMNPAEEVDPHDEGLFPNKSVFARIVTIFGGPFANYLAASLLVFGLALWHGWPTESTPTEPMMIDGVDPGSPAAVAGLKEGDVIVRAGGKPIRNVKQLIDVTGPRAGVPTEYVVQRDGKQLPPMTIAPKKGESGRGVIGVIPHVNTVYTQFSAGKAAQLALAYPINITVRTLAGISDQIKRRTTDGLTGAVGMGEAVYKEAKKGLFPFVHVLVVISVALGFFNLLPFPALDGGRLVFLVYELITRRRPNEQIEATVHAVGVVFLLCVIALVTWRDIARVIS